ncbi:NAD(P)-dependent oxidoreductase [Marinovum sp. 2_MG-2023]|uniref:NAD(P)-dependent oxidoreductase n=1 Tax=unclassified Marinovum TaxID=2647166 RepID=UPI0026E46B53|nr:MULTISPECIES: NAD(P)-dependent oxidoreductase [unclassified Marinovum]MDO6732012.1 NAD(P)-dependent oxidoreductase [Marinovum sp. 2_MG-2023]MDO6781264.1 NAD(P)-dependent oxidoreductase [Marinovum sp. 1_MG-2023]
MNTPLTPGVVAARLTPQEIEANFSDLHPAYDPHEALVAADRCYFCHDAPCVTACPTDIDIPLFIRQIATGMPEAAAKTILEQNILGGMCARVCPTETLCEQSCVRETAEGKPVDIGRLQRHATDALMARQGHPFSRAADTGKHVAVVGAGPAGLACAHRLAMKGHQVTIFEAQAKPGGLNEFGLAAYKTTDDFAAREVDWLLQIGGISIEYGRALGSDLTLAGLSDGHDAVFLGVGLGAVNVLGIDGDDAATDAVDFIADLRQSADLADLPVGRNVVVIGGGMTAVDAAVQSKLLGAQSVTLAYRRGRDRMGASQFEQDLAATKGVQILTNVMPVGYADGTLTLEYTADVDGRLQGTGEQVTLPADQVLRAIGQTLVPVDGLAVERGKIAVTEAGRTSIDGVWAGGDCTAGEDLTVVAVAEGRDAAEDIHSALMAGEAT